MPKMTWNKIPCSMRELNLDIVLSSGQTFRWKKKGDIWQGVLSSQAYFLKQDVDGNLLYHTRGNFMPASKRLKRAKKSEQLSEDPELVLRNFFQLDVNLADLYSHWSSVDPNFNKITHKFSGIRILRQDPTENLISFICSANNNIPRITSMVEKLCIKYGPKITATSDDSEPFHAFPNLSQLAESSVEGELRSQGFGYRAKYINQAAKHIVDNYPPGWLESLRRVPYAEAHSALKSLPGVGAKVADCVCLMSLDKPGAIPVDTHVWQVTVRDYLPELQNAKSLTDRVYQQIGEFYRQKFGDYAGWANTVLFVTDLKQFKQKKKN